jgi:hypothetical protein
MIQQINYSDIIDLGFNEELKNDTAYFKRYGYNYYSITFKLTPIIYIEWSKNKRICTLIELENEESSKVIDRKELSGLDEVKEMIDLLKLHQPDQEAFDLKYELVKGVDIDDCIGCHFYGEKTRCTLPPTIKTTCFASNLIYKLKC